MSGPLYPYQAALFRSRMEILGLTQKSGAKALGTKQRDMRYYCAGRKYAPAEVRDALLALINKQHSKEYHRAV